MSAAGTGKRGCRNGVSAQITCKNKNASTGCAHSRRLTRPGRSRSPFLLHGYGSGAKKLLYLPHYVHKPVHFCRRVVKIKAGARRGFNAQLAHQRLIAVMATAQSHAALISHGDDIVRVNVGQERTHNARPARFWTEESNAFDTGKFFISVR